MIPILLILIILLLLAIGLFLSRKGTAFINVLTNEENQVAANQTINNFSRTSLVLSGLGLLILIFNHQTLSLIYICIIMLISAGFSISLAKKIS